MIKLPGPFESFVRDSGAWSDLSDGIAASDVDGGLPKIATTKYTAQTFQSGTTTEYHNFPVPGPLLGEIASIDRQDHARDE